MNNLLIQEFKKFLIFGDKKQSEERAVLFDKYASLSKPKIHKPYQAHNNEQFLL
jgi:hypothetical protein